MNKICYVASRKTMKYQKSLMSAEMTRAAVQGISMALDNGDNVDIMWTIKPKQEKDLIIYLAEKGYTGI